MARGFRSGDPQAMEAVRLQVRRILAFRGYGIPKDERQDLEQEVLTQLWRAANRSNFRAHEGLQGLVDVVAARRCIDWLRKRREQRELGDDLVDGRQDPLRRVLTRQRAELALAQLGAPCSELIRLHFVTGQSYAELSRVFGKSVGALRVQMHRCLRRARALLLESERPAERSEGGGA